MSNLIEETISIELRDLTFQVEVSYLPSNNATDPRDNFEGAIISYDLIEVYYDQGYAEFPPDTVNWLAEQHDDEILKELQEILL